MRILIDATPLLMRSAGVKNYLYYWIQSLRACAGKIRVDTFPWLDGMGELDHDGSVLGPYATYWRLGLVAATNHFGFPPLAWLARGADVVHLSNQLRRPSGRVAVTATVHDMTCWTMPELHTPANIRADRGFAASVLKRARRLIANSESTRRDAIRVLGLDPDRIDVIYPGVAESFFSTPKTDVAAALERYELARPYILFVGTLEPRKNVDVLLDAYLGMPAGLREEYDLVIAGPLGWARPETRARLETDSRGVRVLGYVPERDLAPLTAGAIVAAYPSLYEGFGFPIVQAMAAGVPVVTSQVSSMPEVAGDAALLVDPRSVAELRSALMALLNSPSLRERLGAAGTRRAPDFRWEECARRSLQFFEKAAGQNT